MSIFADALGAILSGGVTGLAGSGLQFLGGYFKEKRDQKHQLALRALDMDSMKLESQLALSKTEAEGEISKDLATQHAFEKSFEMDRATYTPVNADPRTAWILVSIDAIRGLVRPAITLWMCYLLIRLHLDLQKYGGGMQNLSPSAVEDLWSNVTLTILYIATTVILWWFGSRPQKLAAK